MKLNQELKNDLITTFNEIHQALLEFDTVGKRQIKHRLYLALKWLGKYVSTNDELKNL